MSNLNQLLLKQLSKLKLPTDGNLSSGDYERLLQRISLTYDEHDKNSDRQDHIVDVVNREYAVSLEKLDHLNQHLSELVEEKTNQLLAKQNSIENQKLAALGEMASGIAHEINNPIAIIAGLSAGAQNILATPLNDFSIPNVIKKLSRIDAMVFRTAKIIKGIQNFSRDTDDSIAQAIPLNQVLEDTLTLCSEKFRTAGIDLDIDQIPTNTTVFGNGIRLSQVILNLLNNSYDAVMDTDEPRRVKIGFEVDPNRVIIRIQDSGPGVPQEIEHKIMQPFFTTKCVGKGTGLGLSISSGIIAGLGGSLELNRSISDSCFEIQLPLIAMAPEAKRAS